ncbi:WASH complex subunit 5-like isoform X2 [Homarus americanus]|uniref:WASH complex subunit 5-like isoform X2 n=1 Tax=Homarus americanus TaxID=6706 RepID=UPI001C446ADD|nr:WASH complex subunit 5-like isoform X2 [Homarus americanus]
MDLLAENNVCGQALLRLVARANAIIAELMRLSDFVPPLFRLETKTEQQKYGDVVIDFTYFKAPDGFNKRIEDSPVLADIDDEIRESHSSILDRIYAVFESIHRYVTDLNSFLQDLSEGTFIQRTLENMFTNEDGKQLMCEALYLYGVMLLVVDTLFPGIVRERIIVTHHRHAGQKASDTNIDDVCKLLRSTGFFATPGSKRPVNYPEDYFRRVELPSNYLSFVLGHLRSDDIYHQVQAYPSPEHRSAALANQAAMLFVCLYFTPATLHSQTAKMREIVDKYFPDNWVISYYMGMTVNLIDVWEPYKASKQALNNTLEVSNIREQAYKAAAKMSKLVKQTDQLLAEGSLNEGRVLDHSNRLLNLLRECNVALRWAVLHAATLTEAGGEGNKRCKVVRDQVVSDMQYSPMIVFQLMLNTATLEHDLNQIYKRLVEEKFIRWDKYRKEANEQVIELSEVFAGSRPLARVPKNDRLHKWFNDIGEQILSLKLDDPGSAGRKIIQLIQALKEVKEFHGLESSAGVVQAVGEVVSALQALVRIAGVTEDNLITLSLISDISYAWALVDEYTPIMQSAIKKDPSHVARLRATFLKLSSGLDLPLLRINQARSPDLISVSAYYSGELVAYVRKVLQIIPETMFGLLAKIIKLQTERIKEVPTRLDKDKMKDFAQLPERYQMAELSHSVAVLAEGVAMMDTTLVGVIQVDPRRLLEDGVRRELVSLVARILHDGLTFNTKVKGSELYRRLTLVGQKMTGFRTSFEYIQDYISMYGLKIWQEEMSRIVNYNVEQECNQLLKKKISDHESIYQSVAIPIPKFPPVDTQSVNFIGRLVREILRITDPKTTVYVTQLGTWYDCRTHAEVLSSSVMAKVESSISTAGLTGVDKLLAFLIVTELQNLLREMEIASKKDVAVKEVLRVISPQLNPNSQVLAQPTRQYTGWTQRTSKLTTSMVDRIMRIGQMQILKLHAANRLNSSCKFDAKYLAAALRTMNESLMTDVKQHYADPTRPYPDDDGTLTSELSVFLEWCGMTQPLDRIYITTCPLRPLSIILLLTVIAQISKIHYAKSLGGLTGIKGTEGIDGELLIVGLVTVLRQFHQDHTLRFIQLLAQYITSHTAHSAASSGKTADLPHETVTGIAVLQEVARKMSVSMKTLSLYVPQHLLAAHSG